MPRLIPEVTEAELRTWPSRAEAQVYRAFQTLQDRIVIIHSLATLAVPEAGSAPRDGEADFVVLDPEQGLLVVEVKGGGVAWDGSRQIWTRPRANGARYVIKDPFAQARDRKHDILNLLRNAAGQSGDKLGSVRAGHAVLFPDIDDVSDVRRPDAPREIVGGRAELKSIEGWIGGVFQYWAEATPTDQPLGVMGLSRTEQVLCASFAVEPKLGAKIEREAEVCAYWTDAQWRALQGVRHWSRVAVAGGAGTGKTLLAVRRAQELASSGKKTLTLCFNAALGDLLKGENLRFIESGHASRDMLHTFTFHEFCHWWISVGSQQCGRDLLSEARTAYPRRSVHDVHMPVALAFALELAQPHYQAIVIDEAQDFADEFWLPIEMMAATATLALFYDPNQAIFRMSPTFPIQPDQTYYLSRNCRNTDAIHDAAYRYYRGPLVERSGLQGSPMRRWDEDTLANQASRIAAEVRALIKQEHVPAEDIAVLVLNALHKRSAYDALEREATRLRIHLAEETHGAARRVLLDTVGRFKGLEAAVVVVWLNGSLDTEEHRQSLYVGLSRPRSVLAIVGATRDCDRVCQAS